MMQRRSFLMTVLMSIALVFTGIGGVAAQDATPTSATFADTMGLPELTGAVTDTAFEGLPAETPAGRYLLTLEISAADGGSLNFMQLPEGMSFDDFMALLAGPPAASSEAMMGTPGAEASPAEMEARTGRPSGTTRRRWPAVRAVARARPRRRSST